MAVVGFPDLYGAVVMRFLFRLSQVSFNGLFDTEISCGPLYAVEYGTQFCFWLVKGYGGRCWEVV